jgi:hypothetical protein
VPESGSKAPPQVEFHKEMMYDKRKKHGGQP